MKDERNRKQILARITAILITAVMVVGAPLSAFAASGGIEVDESLLPNGQKVIATTTWSLAPNITETELITNVDSGDHQNMDYICEAKPGTYTKIAAGYKDYDGSKWGMQSTSKQASAYEKQHPDENVVAAINADFFNMSTGAPLGALVMDGVEYNAANGRPYFAILEDGTAVIRDGSVPLDDVKEAIGGYSISVKDGVFVESSDPYGDQEYTRQTIGIKADGTVVTFTTHGRNYPISCGRTFDEIAKTMMALGCTDVLNLDGGGSSTLCTQREGSDEFAMRNSSSDGTERNVSSTLFIISTAKADGEFDHFTVSPNNTLYTQNTTVQFDATPVDSSGAKVEDSKVPEGITWALAEESKALGEIDQEGKFISNGKEGEVIVNLVDTEGKIVGTTSIIICEPDEITWSSDEVNLGFSQSTDLGLIAKWNDREVIIKDGDFDWAITPDSGYEDYNDKLDQIGTFEGNIFTSGAESTVNATITATYKQVEQGKSGSIHAIIGRLPSVVMDFENKVDENGTVVQATDYWTFDKGIVNANGGTIMALTDDWLTARTDASGNLITTTDKVLLIGQYCNSVSGSVINGRGGNSSASIVDIGSGEPVRFGNNALKLNYDFSGTTGIEGACVGFSSQSQEIEGNPTGIGMWVYAPEGTPNLWLRIRVLDGNNNVVTLNFTDRMNDAYNNSGGVDYGGINWTGWKYVEADLTGSTGPFKLLGGETIRVMYTNGAYGITAGKGMGDYLADGTLIDKKDCKGSIYVDNLRFVYGANVDDTETPVIDYISANDVVLTEGAVINSNKVSFKSLFHDIENKYTTGINYDTVYVYVDGKLIGQGKDDAVDAEGNKINSDNYHLLTTDNELRLDDVVLANGPHNIKILLRDGFGNEITETKNFVVEGEEDITSVFAETEEGAPVLNNEYKVYIKSNHIEQVGQISATVKIGKDFAEDISVAFSEDYSSGTYEIKNGEIELTAERSAGLLGGSKDEGTIATITCKVPARMEQGSKFTYSISEGSLELDTAYEGEGYPTNTFAMATKSVIVEAGLNIVIDDLEVGDSEKKLYVYDRDGNLVGKANIYDEETGETVGKTNYRGYLDITDLCENPSKYSFYAEKDGAYSFATEGQSFALGGGEDAAPIHIIANATGDSETSKTFTWLTNPKLSKDAAILQVAEKTDYEAQGETAFSSYEGKTQKQTFKASGVIEENKNVRINEATATGLTAGVAYIYRVGDGENWSETSEFKLQKDFTDVNLFVVGDTQAEDVSVMDTITNSLNASGKEYALGIQTGDLIENAGLYSDWIKGLSLFGNMGSIDMMHVVGNHELFGDSYGDVSEKLFSLPNKKYYSVQYGNVYVATISYTEDRSQYDEAFQWLAEDAAASDAQWKILAIHQPPYYTNPEGGNGYVHEVLPAYAEVAGIDFVFSGHDHAYARTAPIYQGNVDEENGIVYFVCGSTGEKSYTAVDNKDFHFEVLDQDYDAIYLTLSATDKALTVNTCESDGTIIDTYTKKSDNECAKKGHTYVYDGSADLACEACHYVTGLSNYSGWAKAQDSGKDMYFVGGKFQTGWQQHGEDVFYFDEDGLSCKVTLAEDVKTDCTVRGYRLFTCADAPKEEREYQVRYPKAPGHEYDEDSICTVCGWKQIALEDCNISISADTWKYKGVARKPTVTVTYDDGETVKKFKRYSDYNVTYSDNIECGTATITIKPKTSYYVNMTQNRGTFTKENATLTFKIVPTSVSKVTASKIKIKSLTLKWKESDGADGYRIYRYNSAKKKYVLLKTVKSADTLSATLTDLPYASRHTFKVVPYANVKENGKTVKYNGSAVKCYTATKPSKSKITSITAGKKSITVKWSKRTCNGYEVLYATNSSFKNAKKITVSSAKTSTTIKNLKAGKKYYVKVRAYKTTYKGKKVYGLYSGWRSKTTK